jgi:hypothetical protein
LRDHTRVAIYDLLGDDVNIRRDKQSKFWVLSSNQRVLYEGRRSPWDDPAIIRQALDREKSLGAGGEAAQSAGKAGR